MLATLVMLGQSRQMTALAIGVAILIGLIITVVVAGRRRVRAQADATRQQAEEKELKLLAQLWMMLILDLIWGVEYPDDLLDMLEAVRGEELRPGDEAAAIFISLAEQQFRSLDRDTVDQVGELFEDRDKEAPTVQALQQALNRLQRGYSEDLYWDDRIWTGLDVIELMAGAGIDLIADEADLGQIPVLSKRARRGLPRAARYRVDAWGVMREDLDLLDEVVINLQAAAWAMATAALEGTGVLVGISQKYGRTIRKISEPRNADLLLLQLRAHELFNCLPDPQLIGDAVPDQPGQWISPVEGELLGVIQAINATAIDNLEAGTYMPSPSRVSVAASALGDHSGAVIESGDISIHFDRIAGTLTTRNLRNDHVVQIPILINCPQGVMLGRLLARVQDQVARLQLVVPAFHLTEEIDGSPMTTLIEREILGLIQRELLRPSDVLVH